MLRISQKLLVLAVAIAFVLLNTKLSHASPVDSQSKAPVGSNAKSISSTSKSSASKSKPVASKSKPEASKNKPLVSDPVESLPELFDDDRNGRKNSGRHGKREPRNREKRDGGRPKDDIPRFHAVKTLESLSPVQEAKITHIIKEQREKSLPFSEKLKEIREASSSDNGDASRRRKSPEIAGLRRQIHAIKKDAWLRIQKILTPRQKIELEALNESGPPRRKHPDAQPAVHDSGKSFSR